MVTKTVQAVKGLPAKSLKGVEDPFLLTYNTDPKQELTASCKLLMIRRKFHTSMPIGGDVLGPNCPLNDFSPKLDVRHKNNLCNYNRTTNRLPSLEADQQFFIDDRVVYYCNMIYSCSVSNSF